MQDHLLDLKNARKARQHLFFNPLLDRFTNLWLGGVIGVNALRYHSPKVVDKTIISQKTLKQDWLMSMFHVEHYRITGPDIQKPSTLKKILGQQPVFQRPHQGLVFFLLILIAQQMKQTVENNTVQLSVKRLTKD